MKYNHDRPLSDFQDQIDMIKEAGFNPIAVSQLHFEDTFVFKTQEEANNAFDKFEVEDRTVVGWWHGEEDFKDTVKQYERENKGYSKVLIHWL